MKISEAKQTYRAQISAYREQYNALYKQKQELEKKMKLTPDGKEVYANEVYANEAAILELTMQAVDEKQTQYRDYMAKLMEQDVEIHSVLTPRGFLRRCILSTLGNLQKLQI